MILDVVEQAALIDDLDFLLRQRKRHGERRVVDLADDAVLDIHKQLVALFNPALLVVSTSYAITSIIRVHLQTKGG